MRKAWKILLAAAVAADVAMTAALLVKQLLPSAEERLECRCERAMNEAAKREPVEAVAAEHHTNQPDPMDEGFENIMRFAVNGKTGFEVE